MFILERSCLTRMALILKSIGATDTVYGQGSSPAAVVGRIDDILSVVNKPINYPTENTIGDGWLVIGKDPVTP